MPIYHIYRIISELNNERFDDQEEAIYVNCSYNDGKINSDIEKLIHDFKCKNPVDMYLPELKQKANYFKNKKEGQKKMSEMIQRLYDEDIALAIRKSAEAQLEKNVFQAFNHAKNRLNEENAIKDVAEQFELTIPKIKKILKLDNDL